MLIRDCVIEPVNEVKDDTQAHDVLEWMVERGAATLPVIDRDHHVCGRISARDILPAIASGKDLNPRLNVRRLRGDGIPSIPDTESVEKAVEFFRSHPTIDALPVTDDGEIVGVLTLRTLLRTLSHPLENTMERPVERNRETESETELFSIANAQGACDYWEAWGRNAAKTS